MSPTPILDLEAEPPKPRQKVWMGVLIGGVVGYLLASTPHLHLRHFPGLNGFLFLPALYIAVAVHEFGHLLVGSIVGMPPGGLVIGGFVIMKSGQHWNVRFNYRRIFGGGLAKVLPQGKEFRPAAFAWMIAGGPIASVLLTLLCGAAAIRFEPERPGWIGSIFWLSLLAVVVSLFPSSSGTNKSDGARLWELMRHPEQSRRWIAIFALQAQETRGVLPRDWDAELVRQMLQTHPNASAYPYVQLLAYYRMLDEGDKLGALQHLENALAKSARCQGVLRQCLFLEAVSASAYQRENATQARTWLARVGKVHKPMTTDGAEAAIAFCERRYADALHFLAASLAMVEKHKLDSGLARFGKELVHGRQEMCRALMAEKSVSTVNEVLRIRS